MSKNEFLPFGTAANANILSSADYLALPMRTTGFSSGVAKSVQLNTVWRQGSIMAAVLGQFIADSNVDALDDGNVNGLVAKFTNAIISNLGLGEGSSLPVGSPIPWPTNTAPAGWITMSGQAITKNQYPKLYAAYGATLPDLRGEFIRGWDNGRGIDAGRSLLSSQSDAIRNITGAATCTAGPGLTYLQTTDFQGAMTAFGVTTIQPLTGFGASTPSQFTGIYLDASKVVPTASENRPRSIAFNYIVRAA